MMDLKHNKMKMDSESLFSLELVVEKLYIPHEVCRFPSVAFRLLDFPTILIDHVEADLASKIRRKVKSDPYYELPKQINELTDKHGNFVVKKGKSCLLKLPSSTLQVHLSNTPMYVMIIDSYPDVPKLLGNTTVALDQEINNIMEDIRKHGDTIPSVHGDKGLFKVFNLMGKEIGYIILGYRLMSLGSGLIPHIPEDALVKRQSDFKQEKSRHVDESFNEQYSHMSSHIPLKSERDIRKNVSPHYSQRNELKKSQDMGSMTEPEKHDVLMQTVDMCDKEIHVAISDVNVDKPKNLQTVSTQTQRKQKRDPKIVSIALKPPTDESDDELIINNIVHPPPLFYNSENEPAVKIHRPYLYYQDDALSDYTDELTIDDLSDEERKYKKVSTSRQNVNQSVYQKQMTTPAKTTEMRQPVVQPTERVPAPGQLQNLMNGFPASVSNGPLFPMLTALLTELSKLQDPRFVQTAVNQVNVITQERQERPKPLPRATAQKAEAMIHEKSVLDENKENLQNEKDIKRLGRKSHKVCAAPSDGVPKKKGWIRQTPNISVNKSKLAFGLTNTQRLRLAKVNPDWLKTMEKEEKDAKSLKSRPVKKEEEEFETGNLSDTLTEVRRLAKKNLNEMDNTMEDVNEKLENTANSTVKKNRRRISPPRRHKPITPSGSPFRKRSKSPKHKYLSKVQMSSKSDSKEEEGIVQENMEYDQHVSDEEDVKSYKSIEVRIPSAQLYEGDSDFTESPKSYKYPGYMEKNESDEGSTKNNRFPGFMDQNVSVPESINGRANESLNFTKDNEYEEDEQPLESTRYSRPNKSHDDIDTHQFQSTDEPELQKLMSSGEKSEVSDILSTDRSIVSPLPPAETNMASARFQVLNPKASMNSPLPAIRRSQAKPEGSVTKTSPVVTPRSPGSSRHPTPTPRKKPAQRKRLEYKHESIHTESVSSYVPSDEDDFLGNESYSDDFNENSSRMSPNVGHSSNWIPSTKLGYTIS